MNIRSAVEDLISGKGISDILALELPRVQRVIPGLPHRPSGSLLATHLKAGSMMDEVACLYLDRQSEEDILEAVKDKHGAPKTIRGLWSAASRHFTLLTERAVKDTVYRSLPPGIRERNIALGDTDVLEIPATILSLASSGGLANLKTRAADEVRALLVLIVMNLFGTKSEYLPIGRSAYTRFYMDITAAVALSKIGCCPEGRGPPGVVSKLLSSRKKSSKSARVSS